MCEEPLLKRLSRQASVSVSATDGLHACIDVAEPEEGGHVAADPGRRQQEDLLRLHVVEAERFEEHGERLASGIREACLDQVGVELEAAGDCLDQGLVLAAPGKTDDLGCAEDRPEGAIDAAARPAVATDRRARRELGHEPQARRTFAAEEGPRIEPAGVPRRNRLSPRRPCRR